MYQAPFNQLHESICLYLTTVLPGEFIASSMVQAIKERHREVSTICQVIDRNERQSQNLHSGTLDPKPKTSGCSKSFSAKFLTSLSTYFQQRLPQLCHVNVKSLAHTRSSEHFFLTSELISNLGTKR
jgi:hypothetical protein